MFDALTIDWHDRAPTFLAALVFGYALGSIPFGLMFSWAAGAGDVRKIGSGNIGATNVLRTGKRWAAAATLICDGGKGAVAVLLAASQHGVVAAVFAGLGAFLGHVFPVWLRFRGGKGVATACGVFSVLTPLAVPPALVIFFVTAWATKYISLASVLATIALPPIAYAMGSPAPAVVAAFGAAAIIVFRHRSNLVRLRTGSERRLGARV